MLHYKMQESWHFACDLNGSKFKVILSENAALLGSAEDWYVCTYSLSPQLTSTIISYCLGPKTSPLGISIYTLLWFLPGLSLLPHHLLQHPVKLRIPLPSIIELMDFHGVQIGCRCQVCSACR